MEVTEIDNCIIASRVWSGTKYHYPNIEKLKSALAAARALCELATSSSESFRNELHKKLGLSDDFDKTHGTLLLAAGQLKDENQVLRDQLSAATKRAEDAEARAVAAEKKVEWLTIEWQRMRKTLNAIAWGSCATLEYAREMAKDTLAIGVKVANERAVDAANAMEVTGVKNG